MWTISDSWVSVDTRVSEHLFRSFTVAYPFPGCSMDSPLSSRLPEGSPHCEVDSGSPTRPQSFPFSFSDLPSSLTLYHHSYVRPRAHLHSPFFTLYPSQVHHTPGDPVSPLVSTTPLPVPLGVSHSLSLVVCTHNPSDVTDVTPSYLTTTPTLPSGPPVTCPSTLTGGLSLLPRSGFTTVPDLYVPL